MRDGSNSSSNGGDQIQTRMIWRISFWLFIVRRWITMREIYCGDAFLRCRLLCVRVCLFVFTLFCVNEPNDRNLVTNGAMRQREWKRSGALGVKGNGSRTTYLQRRHGAKIGRTEQKRLEGQSSWPHGDPLYPSLGCLYKTQAAQLKSHVCVCAMIMAEYWSFLYFTNILHYRCAHHLCHLIPLVIYYVVGFGMSFISRLASPMLLLCPFASKMLLLLLLLLLVLLQQQPCYYRTIFDSFNTVWVALTHVVKSVAG